MRFSTTVIFGNSGAGKSTYAKKLVTSQQAAHLDMDNLAWEATNPPTRPQLGGQQQRNRAVHSSQSKLDNRMMRVVPHWLLNLVGFKSKSFTLIEDRLYLKNSDQSTLEILPSVFTKKDIIFKGLFFWYLILETDQGKLKVGGVSEAIAYKTINMIKGYSYQYVQPKVSQLAENIRAQLNDGYLRRSKIDRISLLAKSLYDQFSVLPEEGLVGAAAFQDFLLLSHIVTNPENKNGGAWFDEYKASYLVRYRSKYKQYFDEVESNPLTDKQRCNPPIINVN